MQWCYLLWYQKNQWESYLTYRNVE